MAYEPRRPLLIALSALAVVLAASLFPAAGVGTHPGGQPGGGPGAPGPSSPTVPDGPESTPTPATTPTAESTPEATATPSAAPTATAEPTATPTATAVPPDESGGDWLPSLSLAALLEFLAMLLVASVLLTLGLVLRGARPGTPYVDLPGGFTVTLPFAVPPWLARLPTRLSRSTMGYVVGLSATVPRLLDVTGHALGGVVRGLAIALGESARGSARLLLAVPRAVSVGAGGLVAVGAGLTALPGALSRLRAGLGSSDPDQPATDARDVAPAPETPDDDADDGDVAPPSVADAWVAMTELVPVSRPESTTPAEFARAAVDHGLPAEPVVALTRAFQAVAYGGRSEGEYVGLARRALARIRRAVGGEAG